MKWRAAMDRTLAPLGLTHAQFVVLANLSALARAGRRPSQRELADLTGLEPIYMSKLARALEKAGLVDRPVAEDDPRAVRLTITDRGRDIATEAIQLVHAKHAEQTEAIGGPDGTQDRALRDTLLTLLGDTPFAHRTTHSEGEHTMTAPRTFNGRNITIAAAATRSILDTLAAREGLTFEHYVTLRVLVGSDGPTDRDTLVTTAASPVADETVLRRSLDHLTTAGLARATGNLIEVTSKGRTLMTKILEESTRAGDKLFDGIAESDIAAAQRVLDTVTERAAAVQAQL